MIVTLVDWSLLKEDPSWALFICVRVIFNRLLLFKLSKRYDSSRLMYNLLLSLLLFVVKKMSVFVCGNFDEVNFR